MIMFFIFSKIYYYFLHNFANIPPHHEKKHVEITIFLKKYHIITGIFTE